MQLFKNKKIASLESEIKSLSLSLQKYQQQQIFASGTKFINEAIAYYPEWGVTDYIDKYVTMDQVFSVVNKIAETAAMIPIYPYIVKQEKSIKQLKTITNRHFYTTKGIYDIRMIQTKALEDAPDSDALYKLLENPNPHDSKNEFFLKAYIYYLLKECFIYKRRLGVNEGANSGKVKELYVLPPHQIGINATREFPQQIVSYTFFVNGIPVYENIPVDDIIHIKRFNPQAMFGSVESLHGLSPLQAACKLLSRMTAEDDAATAQMQNGGLPGVIYDKSIPYDVDGQVELDRKRKSFFDFINSKENKGAPYFSAGELGYIVTGLKLVDMEVSAIAEIDFKRLCNLYKISDILFNQNDAATESNVNEQIKQMYTNACLPLVYKFRDALNASLVNDFNDKTVRFIDCDISSITELQDDLQEMATILATLPITPTGNEIRDLFKYDRIDDLLMGRPLVKQGYALIDDLNTGIINPDDLQP